MYQSPTVAMAPALLLAQVANNVIFALDREGKNRQIQV